ncbi:hypothetical protein [Aquimarina muelleri]|uniref:Uncharacterized protein n=1 Tax=Aquimarina muelleri TaxID=279356 RepID=A0A918JWW6_9FLAO|nr:hypothetical protein [Aquimarina muelleri]MCX2763504.1 hypothetical protein [Aquimarina muelleri]GGX25511.1 hypothetical protein GCM10007384_28250 [Aquimarina muelleri]
MKTKFLSVLFLFTLLFTSCSGDDDAGKPDTGGETEVTLVTYSDIEFSLTDSSNTNGRVFSTSSGKVYKDSEINAENAEIIDIVSATSQAFIAFDSPHKATDPTIVGARITKYQPTGVSLTAADFDAMTDDSKLKSLIIVDDNETISISDYENKIVLFENASGKKGAIKLKALNANRLLVDIKVIK